MKSARTLSLLSFTVCTAALLVLALPLACAEEKTPARAPLTITQDKGPLDRADSGRITSFADVVEPITPGVISVFSTRVVEDDPRREQLEEFLRRMYGLPPAEEDEDDEQPERMERGMGSGFIVSENGYILTNHHVVAGRSNEVSDDITVKLPDGREFEAEFIGSDPDTDIAVLKIEGDNLPALKLADSDQLRVGDIVFAVGNPLDVGLTVTNGIISALGRNELRLPGGPQFQNFIQTDAAINLGNSGGPLIDAEGRVVGINTAILSTGFRGGSIGIGFAIPVNMAYKVMRSLIETGEVRRGFVGLRPGPLTFEMAKALGLDSTKGALVESVIPGMPAAKAGIKHGDVILFVDGDQVDTWRELIYLIARRSPGETVSLDLIRWGEEKRIDIALADRNDYGATATSAVPSRPATLLEGIVVKVLDLQYRDEYDIPDDVESGLIVIEIEPGSPYGESLEPGMVITEINGQPVTALDEARELLKTNVPNAFYVYRPGSGYTYIPIKIED